MLEDMNTLIETSGFEGAFTYSEIYLDFEHYQNLPSETAYSITLSLIAVLLVIFLITASCTITFLVALCVVLVDVYLLALIHFWGMTINMFVVL